MGSYCPICDQFVDNLDDCELPYGGAPAPRYAEYLELYEPDPRALQTPLPLDDSDEEENLDVLENPYYIPPSLPENFQLFLRSCSPANSTRSKTQQTRQRKLNRAISPLLNEIRQIYGIENQLVIIDQIYVILKDNMDVLKKNVKLYDVSKLKLDEFIRDFPVEAGYLKTLRNQMFGQKVAPIF